MSEFIDSLNDVFVAFGAISSKRMFGGYGIYHDGLMFALVADDQLYLKADQQSETVFKANGLPAFQFEKNGKLIKMSYFLAPESLYDDPQSAKEWATRAYDAALRHQKPKRKKT